VAATAFRWEITAPRLGLGDGQALGYRLEPDVPRSDPATIEPDVDRFGTAHGTPTAPPDVGARPLRLVVYLGSGRSGGAPPSRWPPSATRWWRTAHRTASRW
jgi:hypothetical protein